MLALVAHLPDCDARSRRPAGKVGARFGHGREGLLHLQLPGGLAGQINKPFETTLAHRGERHLEQNAGFAKSGWRFERDDPVTLQSLREFGLRGFLAGATRREGRSKLQSAQAFPRPPAQIEELRDALEPRREQQLVRPCEANILGQTAVGFDEDQLRADRRFRCGKTAQGDVRGQLREIRGIIGAQVFLGERQRGGDRLDLAQQLTTCGVGHDLVDASGQRDRPAAVKHGAVDRHFKPRAGMIRRGLRLKFTVPVGAELRTPQPGRPVAPFAWSDGKIGEFADAQFGGALDEIEVHRRGSLDPVRSGATVKAEARRSVTMIPRQFRCVPGGTLRAGAAGR